ncbi:MAG: ATPase [Lachnospiraceae bacterium]
MISRMEQIIEEIEDYIDSCKFYPLSNTKIVVNKDELEELLTELKLKTPEEIKKYQKIISNKEAIMADAQAKAEAVIAEAQIHTTELVSEHQIMQQAYAQANEVVLIATNQAQEILDNATTDANNIRMASISYTDDMLNNMESIISTTMETSRAKFDNFYTNLQHCYDIVDANRTELSPAELDSQEAEDSQENRDYDEAAMIEFDTEGSEK